MIWATTFFLILSFLGGVARLVMFFKNSPTSQGLEPRLSKKGLMLVAIINIAFASAGMYCLFAEVFAPLEILIAVLLVTSLVEFSLTIAS